MNASTNDPMRSAAERGPSIYYGYCGRSGRYRMMDLPDYLTNLQQGMSRWMSDAQTAYQDVARNVYAPPFGQHAPGRSRPREDGGCRECGRDSCHCECCVCDADVLVHARCGELRRIPVTFENDTRRERPVKLELEKFVTAGGRDVNWVAALSETEFTLKPCDEHTVIVSVAVVCGKGDDNTPDEPKASTKPGSPAGSSALRAAATAAANRAGNVDRCEVGYATLRAEGCLVRPAVIAVAVLPNDCDAYRRPCSCGCCH